MVCLAVPFQFFPCQGTSLAIDTNGHQWLDPVLKNGDSMVYVEGNHGGLHPQIYLSCFVVPFFSTVCI